MWVYLFVCVSAGVAVAAPALDHPLEALLGFAICTVCGVAPMSFLYQTIYTITESELKLRSGPIRIDVPLHSVRGIQDPPRSRWRGIAFGMSNRTSIMVEYEGAMGGARISPEDKAGFIEALRERCPDLRLS